MSKLSKETLQRKYDRAAHWYDPGETLLGWLGLGRLRHKLLRKASGDVLEVAVGTGKNLPYYPRGCNVTATDLSPEMLTVARKRADRLDIDMTFYVMDAEALDFPDGSFDTVVSTLSTCTFPDPIEGLPSRRENPIARARPLEPPPGCPLPGPSRRRVRETARLSLEPGAARAGRARRAQHRNGPPHLFWDSAYN